MVFSYYNPQTGTYTEYSYYYPDGRALDNEFYILTSNATFSAANLFVSIVMDNDLALVFGTDTGGGACAINIALLPNNMALVYSSNLMILDENYDNVEFGCSPDVILDESYAIIADIHSFVLVYESDDEE